MNWEKIFVTYKTESFYPNYTEFLGIHEQKSVENQLEKKAKGKKQEEQKMENQAECSWT